MPSGIYINGDAHKYTDHYTIPRGTTTTVLDIYLLVYPGTNAFLEVQPVHNYKVGATALLGGQLPAARTTSRQVAPIPSASELRHTSGDSRVVFFSEQSSLIFPRGLKPRTDAKTTTARIWREGRTMVEH